jgi:hypothetical protein
MQPKALWAQSSAFETVYFSQPNNKIMKVVRFDANGPGEVATAIQKNGTLFRGIVVRQDGLILVANGTHSGGILVCDPDSGNCATVLSVKHPEAMDISTSTGGLIAVYDKERIVKLDATGCVQTFQSPGCRPGGYQVSVASAKVSGHLFADVKFARTTRGVWTEGDIALLSGFPGKLLKLSQVGGTPVPVISSIKFEGKPRIPTGLAFNANGDALIATLDGLILLYPEGAGTPQRFAHLGGLGAKLTVGLQGQPPETTERVFASVKNGRVQCYESDGSSCGKVTRAIVPDGIGIATGAFQVTEVPAGGGPVSQTLALGLRTEWEEILSGGVSVALCRQFPDPRELGPGFLDADFNDVDLYLCKPGDQGCAATNADPFVDLGLPSIVPGTVRAFRPGAGPDGPFTGPPTFQVCVMTTTAGFRGIIQDHVGTPVTINDDINTWIGYDFHQACPAPGVYYSPGPNDEPIVEGFHFTDVTLACNHPLGGSWSRSTLLTGARTDMTACEEAAFKLENLAETFENVDFPPDAGPSCDIGTTIPGGRPAGAIQATMEAAIGSSLDDWALVDPSKGVFGGDGTSGNGFLLGNGTILVKAKNASFHHEFGTTDAGHGTLSPVIANSEGQVGVSFPLIAGSDPYAFCFKNVSGTSVNPIFSDQQFSGVLGIAVYQNKVDPTLFALFFDDGGGAPDKDFDDLVVTATAPVGTKCGLELALSQARKRFQAACGPGQVQGTIDSLQDFVDAIDGAPLAHFPAGNMDAQLKARAQSLIFVLDMKVDPDP